MYLGSVGNLNSHRHRHTLELLTAFLNSTVLVEQRIKHALAVRRPVEYSPQIQPIIPAPGHGSFPSGHSTEAFMAAFVILALMQGGKAYPHGDAGRTVFEQLMRHAERIAINRTVAGVHFPVDSAAGMVLGLTLSEYWIARCSKKMTFNPRVFSGAKFKGDFSYTKTLSNLDKYAAKSDSKQDSGKSGKENEGYCEGPAQSPVLKHLWQMALKEWSI